MTERMLPNQDLYVENIKGWSQEKGIRVIKEIGEKSFTIKCGGFQLRTELMNQTNKTFNAIQVMVMFSSRQNKEITDEVKEQFDELLLIIMDYWHEYATLNDYESVLLVDYFHDCELEPIFKSDTQGEEPREDVISSLFAYYPMLQKGRLLGAKISKNIECNIQNFLKAKPFLEQALSTSPLIHIFSTQHAANINALIRKNASILVEYEDSRFLLTLMDDYQSVMFYTLNEKKEQEVLLVSPVNNSKNAVEKVIEQFKEENKLKHLVKPPMKHFKNFFSTHDSNLSYEHYHHEFDSLLSIMGDWEQVESEFILLNKRNKLDCTVDSYDSIRKSRIRVHECKSELYRYFFVTYKHETDEGEKYECSIIVSKDLQGFSGELQRKLQQLFIKGL